MVLTTTAANTTNAAVSDTIAATTTTATAPSTSTPVSADQLCKQLESLRQAIIGLVENAEKNNRTEMSVKATQIKTSFEQLRAMVDNTPDIRRSEKYQLDKIADLRRQMALKDEFLRTISKRAELKTTLHSMNNNVGGESAHTGAPYGGEK